MLEKKARLKRDAEGISESEASDNECAQERSKFRRRSKESKVNSSASEISDSEYSSAGPGASPARGGSKGKTRRRVNVKGGRGKTKKKIIVIELKIVKFFYRRFLLYRRFLHYRIVILLTFNVFSHFNSWRKIH